MKKLFFVMGLLAITCVSLSACEEKQENEKANENVNVNNASSQASNINVIEEKKEILVSGEISGENIVVDQIEETKDSSKETNEYTLIKFSDMYETKGTEKNVSQMLKNLNGKKVQIKGYPAVQSPLDESFVYLNNQPYVTCPFCTIGDITKLEVIPIFMANKSKIKYTENAMDVYGKLEIAPKVDSEGYTTQFRIFADKVEEVKNSNGNKDVNNYYSLLSQQGMIYDIQTLQMNIEYASNPNYQMYYDEKYQTGASKTLNMQAIVKGISDEYLGYDSQYGNGYGSNYTYLIYIKECPAIVKQCEPQKANLKQLNEELINLYLDEIKLLEKFENICYRIHKKNSITEAEAQAFAKELNELNAPNVELYNRFTAWNNKLRES